MENKSSSLRFRLPPRATFYPPERLPAIAPISQLSQWPLLEQLYFTTLDTKLPFLVAVIYLIFVFIANGVNRRRCHRRWAVSSRRPFKNFVILHNLMLAFISGWMFMLAINGYRYQLLMPVEFHSPHYIAHILCKWSKPSILLNTTSNIGKWNDHYAELLVGGAERLNLVAWIFYLSKFYELIDTAIILCSGKEASSLQAFHHAGIIISVWLCVRARLTSTYIGVLLNCAVHTVMYTYYSISTVSRRRPKLIKMALTTLQIAQFVIGSTVALAYAFVQYQLPNTEVEGIRPNKDDGIPLSTSNASSVYEFEYNGMPKGPIFCIDTPEQASYIYPFFLYMVPLTYMFTQFFIKSYMRPAKAKAE